MDLTDAVLLLLFLDIFVAMPAIALVLRFAVGLPGWGAVLLAIPLALGLGVGAAVLFVRFTRRK